MRSQADILCGEDDWNSLMAISLIGIILFCGGFFVLNIWIACVAPKRFNEVQFQKRWKFLFIKYRPSCWWWGLTLLVKGIWINLPTVVFDFGAAQILWLQSAIVIYLVGCFAFMPWRNFTVGALDILMHAILIFIFGFVTHFVDMGDSDNDELGTAFVGFAMTPIAAGGIVGIRMLYIRFIAKPRDEAFWLKTATEVCDVFAKSSTPNDLARVMCHLPISDIVSLNNAKRILQAEIFFDTPGKPEHADGLLKVASRTRLATSTSGTSLGNQQSESSSGIEQSNEKEVKDIDDVHKNIAKMRAMLKPDEVWLATALETAVTGRTMDVEDILKHIHVGPPGAPGSDDKEAVEGLDDLDFPGEYTGPLLNSQQSAFAPRTVPTGKLTKPHAGR